nr:F-box/LRR-repeat protein At4g14096-like isoform X1 [Setaria viridis]XP_034588249.1 F-box/LRR-repeat protein At4g14096-like isoform X1 [Setaria viridis]
MIASCQNPQRRLDARRLFDGMPRGKKAKSTAPTAPAPAPAGIDALPDGVLEHILGFLPSPEAVRTCVLARRWRHLWRNATGLRVSCLAGGSEGDSGEGPPSPKRIRDFLERILLLRGQAPLETFELRFCTFDGDGDDTSCLSRWVQHAVECKVRTLRLENIWVDGFELEDRPLVSQLLTRLQLEGLDLKNTFCDFSGCPSLEHLVIESCEFWDAYKVSSESLKHLCMTSCIFSKVSSTVIHAPSLVSLRLDGHLYRAPVLEIMPSLQGAFVRAIHENLDSGYCDDYSGDCDGEDCYSCYGAVDCNYKCMLLEGLSEAENLALISESKVQAEDFDTQ